MICLLKTRNQKLKEKALAGDGNAQLKYAWNCYKGKRMKRSISAAKYWSFKALTQGVPSAEGLCEICSYPYYTGNEYYKPYKPFSISLNRGNGWYSDKFRLRCDKYKEQPGWYRTYYVFRFVLLFIPKGAYRVFESSEGFRVIGRERWHFFEYIWWILLDAAVLSLVFYLILN